jgi:hypothetical protein
MTFSFSNLSLAGVQAATAGASVPPGKYVAKVKEVEVADTKNGNGKILKVKLTTNKGVITDNINVYNTSEQAMKIGLEQLKSLLVNGGHPDPDNIGQHGVASIRGLSVGIVVGAETYNGNQSSKVKGYMKPENVPATDGSAPAAPAIGNGGLPF